MVFALRPRTGPAIDEVLHVYSSSFTSYMYLKEASDQDCHVDQSGLRVGILHIVVNHLDNLVLRRVMDVLAEESVQLLIAVNIVTLRRLRFVLECCHKRFKTQSPFGVLFDM